MTTQPEALRLADVAFAARDARWHTQADDELRRLHANAIEDAAERRRLRDENEYLARNGIHSCHSECRRPVCKLTRERGALLEALKGMEARFGCESSRSETKPKTYGCRHMAETCGNCYGLVTGWMAVQAARAAIKAVEENT